jgi:hypothetical protein
VTIADDPYLDSIAARIAVDGRGRLELVAHGSRNFAWTRIRSVALGKYNRFLIGEQRFVWTLPGGTVPPAGGISHVERAP